MKAAQWDKYAKEYHKHIISPFSENVRNPLYDDIKRLPKTRVIADLGTGCGPLLPRLARFRKVYAIDFSRKMLEQAKKKAPKNTTLLRQDLKHLSKLSISYDVAIAVNSVLHPDMFTVDTILKEIYDNLSRRGRLLAVFPSMESVLYQFQLVYRSELRRWDDSAKALTNTRRLVELRKYDMIRSTYTDGREVQKFYYRFELRQILKKAGFSDIKFSKVFYPWGRTSGDYIDFHGKPEMWDWYVTARK
ncbi:class I SAM-dependent methyltransferase [Candidatus Woesearchaeota archaeon]|nr:class I SAM-dependent methyltransferase [Candidatus Woesearchaeota archaeon]